MTHFRKLSLFVCLYHVVLFCAFLDKAFGAQSQSHEFAVDYYWRTQDPKIFQLSCQDEIFKLICSKKCEGSYYCQDSKCTCTRPRAELYLPQNKNQAQELFGEQVSSLLDAIAKINMQEKSSESVEEDPYRPSLRHHIAHFCPDLEVARQCIRKCQKEGKPAFCGKDHVCYCSHKYTSHDRNDPIDLEAVRNQFLDLYTKYFGPKLFDEPDYDNDNSIKKMKLKDNISNSTKKPLF